MILEGKTLPLRPLYPSLWWREGLAAAVIFFIIAVIFTWPLARHFTEAIPTGRESPSVALVQLFMPQWSGVVIEQGKPYWNPPFLYPFQGAFAWTEPQPFTCFLIWLCAKLTGYIAAYNIIVLIYLAGLGLAGYAVARLITEDRLGALLSGMWLTGNAYSLEQICALNIIAGVFPGACIFFILLFAKNRRLRFFWLAILSYLLSWVTCKQTTLFLTLLLPTVLWPFFSWKKLQRSALINCFFALIIISVLILPYTLQQLSYLRIMGFQRSLSSIRAVLRIEDLFRPAKGHWLTTHILGWGNELNYYSRDIGIICLSMIILSVFLGGLRNQALNSYQRKVIAGLITMVMVALFLGFGPGIGVVIQGKHYSPYAFLYSIIPGFNLIRAPARWVRFSIFGIAVLSVPAFEYLRKRIRTKIIVSLITILFFVLLCLEMWTVPVSYVFPNQEIREHLGMIDWLKKHGGGQPVLELPLSFGLRPVDMELDAGAMLRMLQHKNPIVNGYISFSPTPFRQLRMAMDSDPKGSGRRYLDAYNVRYAVLHKHLVAQQKQDSLASALGDTIVYDDARHTIYLLPEKRQIQNLMDFLPSEALFRNKIPQEGSIYGVLLSSPITQAVLIRPQANWWIKVSWIDALGVLRTKKVRLHGSVILDSGQVRLYFQLLHFPAKGAQAEARLVAAEEIAKN
jgi:hypothetical protein